jgi:hypothetical protein
VTNADSFLQTISDPLREGYHFDQSLGGIAGLFENMRSNTQVSTHTHDIPMHLSVSIF